MTPHMPHSIQNSSCYTHLSFYQPNPLPCHSQLLHWPTLMLYPTLSSSSICKLPLPQPTSTPLLIPQVHEDFPLRMDPHTAVILNVDFYTLLARTISKACFVIQSFTGHWVTLVNESKHFSGVSSEAISLIFFCVVCAYIVSIVFPSF